MGLLRLLTCKPKKVEMGIFLRPVEPEERNFETGAVLHEAYEAPEDFERVDWTGD
jgi:hypothetical protein